MTRVASNDIKDKSVLFNNRKLVETVSTPHSACSILAVAGAPMRVDAFGRQEALGHCSLMFCSGLTISRLLLPTLRLIHVASDHSTFPRPATGATPTSRALTTQRKRCYATRTKRRAAARPFTAANPGARGCALTFNRTICPSCGRRAVSFRDVAHTPSAKATAL